MDNPNLQQSTDLRMAPPAQPVMPPTPQMPKAAPGKKVSAVMWIVLVLAIAAAACAWWYIGQMAPEPVVQQQPVIDKEAREDKMIGADIQSVDVGNIDKELESIDKDINSL